MYHFKCHTSVTSVPQPLHIYMSHDIITILVALAIIANSKDCIILYVYLIFVCKITVVIKAIQYLVNLRDIFYIQFFCIIWLINYYLPGL